MTIPQDCKDYPAAGEHRWFRSDAMHRRDKRLEGEEENEALDREVFEISV